MRLQQASPYANIFDISIETIVAGYLPGPGTHPVVRERHPPHQTRSEPAATSEAQHRCRHPLVLLVDTARKELLHGPTKAGGVTV